MQATASGRTGWSQAFERGALYASGHGTWPVVLARDKAAFDGRSGLDGVGWPMGMPTSTTGHGITGTTQSFSGNSALRETARILVHDNKSAVVKATRTSRCATRDSTSPAGRWRTSSTSTRAAASAGSRSSPAASWRFDPGCTPLTQRYLNCYALKQLDLLQGAYRAHFGRYARIDLTYRPLAEQWYWFNKFGSPRAATPGTSPHGFGISIDFQENRRLEHLRLGSAGQPMAAGQLREVRVRQPVPVRHLGRVVPLRFPGLSSFALSW
ncbi:hypothetical protein [Yimella sp. cx-51]|uniref:hypothetical protein n=1 Tax=Yimella sp. cx-51 TaxID=2770551 RepID=UPI00165EA573|nr:hypothetical protein [Yimella sp. cx-51]MBC9956242.1 hypothetical protein [Yimella sp. cx-51]QTH38612.1 hypothetical protein J5M86_02845 [Yimella sp. cx-51]